MSDAFNTPDLFSELERLQRQMSGLFGGFPTSLRSTRVGTFPQINVGSTEDSVEIVAFAPGLDVSKLDVSVDKGLLTIAGERGAGYDRLPEGTRQYAQERFRGAFRRVIELPQQADPDKVQARYSLAAF
jgi:HSP20 family protein